MSLTASEKAGLLALIRNRNGDDLYKFLNETLVAAGAIADASNGITVTYTSGSAPAADGSLTVANSATPTVVELLAFCEELNASVASLDAKVNAIIAALSAE